MSIINYCKNLRLFSSYENQIIKILTKEFLSQDLLEYNIQQILKEVEIYWYKDTNINNLGGFSVIGKDSKTKKWSIYINWVFSENLNEHNDMLSFHKILTVIPTILHQLVHYNQYKKYKLFYWLLQLPIIRNFTIEKHADKITKQIENNTNITQLNFVDEFCLKLKYNVNNFYLNGKEIVAKNYIQTHKIDYMNVIYNKIYTFTDILTL